MTAYAEVPQELKNLPNWVVWQSPSKMPFNPLSQKKGAKSNDPDTWSTFSDAVNTEVLEGFSEIGFELRGTNLVGIDFDSAVMDGKADPYVLAILALLGNPYCELSPSGKGLHAFVECEKLPEGKRKFTNGNHEGIEIYHGSETAPYLTVTGNRFSGNDVPKISDISLPYLLISQNLNKSFKKLWLGDLSDYKNDHSAADAALCWRLAQLLNRDAAKIETVFSASALGQRSKWTDRPKYRKATIDFVLSCKKEPTEGVPDEKLVEEYVSSANVVSEYPRMGNDLISQYARLLVQGTAIPFCHVREDLKIVLAFCLDDSVRYPDHEKLFIRGWHFNLGEPETGKTTAWDYVKDRWSHVLSERGIHLDRLSSYGSSQYLVKGFEEHPKMLLYVTEGNTLATSNDQMPAVFGSLGDLYDQSYISAGSYKNKPAKCANAEGSCVICITPDDFVKTLQSKGVIGGGVLPRWTISYSDLVIVEGDWPARPEQGLNALRDKMLRRLGCTTVRETAEAKAIRAALAKEMTRSDMGPHGKRIIEHYKREALLAAVFSDCEPGLITREIAEWAAAWARHQTHLRNAYWPIDAGSNVERMETAMRKVLKKAYPKGVSLKTLKDAAHAHREGSGGMETFQRAFRAMMGGQEMKVFGINRKGSKIFVYSEEIESLPIAAGVESDSNPCEINNLTPAWVESLPLPSVKGVVLEKV